MILYHFIQAPTYNVFVITGVNLVSFSDWEAIDEYEKREGETRGKPREKVVDMNTMMNIVNTSRQFTS